MREPGIYEGIPNSEYHRGLRTDVKPLSSTFAKELIKYAPVVVEHRQRTFEASPAMWFGQAFHELVLEGGYQTVEWRDYATWQSKAAIEDKLAILAQDLTPGLMRDRPALEGMQAAVLAHPDAGPILASGGETEVAALAFDPVNEVWLQAKFDWISVDEESKTAVFMDLKSVQSSMPDEFARDAVKYDYPLQRAFYAHVLRLLGYTVRQFAWLTVEKTAPYLVGLHDLTPDDQEFGQSRVNHAILKYKQYLEYAKAGEYPGLRGINTPDLPVWYGYDTERITNE